MIENQHIEPPAVGEPGLSVLITKNSGTTSKENAVGRNQHVVVTAASECGYPAVERVLSALPVLLGLPSSIAWARIDIGAAEYWLSPHLNYDPE